MQPRQTQTPNTTPRGLEIQLFNVKYAGAGVVWSIWWLGRVLSGCRFHVILQRGPSCLVIARAWNKRLILMKLHYWLIYFSFLSASGGSNRRRSLLSILSGRGGCPSCLVIVRVQNEYSIVIQLHCSLIYFSFLSASGGSCRVRPSFSILGAFCWPVITAFRVCSCVCYCDCGWWYNKQQ